MWDMFVHSAKLFLAGKLFRDPQLVLRCWLLGVGLTAGLLLVFSLAGLPLWANVVMSAAIGGSAQTHLFQDLKYN